MAGERVLVVEDETNIARLVRAYLERDGYVVGGAGDGAEACALVDSWHPDLVILDLMLPKVDGWEVCRRIRSRPGVDARIPVIMLTAKGEEFDKVLGLELGADDYVTKPFSPRELVARVRAVLRRSAANDSPASAPAPAPAAQAAAPDAETLAFADFTISRTSRELTVRGKPVPCTAKEFDLLWLLSSQPGRVYSRELLLERVWDYDYPGDGRTVDVHIRRIRTKIETEPANPQYLITVWGVGYKFVARPAGER